MAASACKSLWTCTHLSPAEAADLMARADQRCPYSNATRGNIQVALSVDGRSIERAAA
jgi:lipoyl-dependent peroxiredoxin